MNRSIVNVILGGFGTESGAARPTGVGDRLVKSGSAEDAAFILKNAGSVIIVPVMAWRSRRPSTRCARWRTI